MYFQILYQISGDATYISIRYVKKMQMGVINESAGGNGILPFKYMSELNFHLELRAA